MAQWVAVSFGALDLRGRPEGAGGTRYAVTPTAPGEPLMLAGEVAALWRRLADGPVDDGMLTTDEREVLAALAAEGIVSDDAAHAHRVREVPAPWLTSFAHELVYALVANVARQHDVAAVFIKGPVLHAQGLREREHSGDVDVWVRPGTEGRLGDALVAWGWRAVPSPLDGMGLSHSVTLRSEAWGCEIDVHTRFPGIGVSPPAAFGTLQRHTEARRFAGVTVSTPAVDAHAIVFALHALRPARDRPLTPQHRRMAESALRDGGAGVVPLADEWRATAALGTSFSSATGADPSTDDAPADWRWRSRRATALAYLEAARTLPSHRRPAAIARMVWPSAAVALASDARAGGTARNATEARLRRIARGVGQLFRRRGGGTP